MSFNKPPFNIKKIDIPQLDIIWPPLQFDKMRYEQISNKSFFITYIQAVTFCLKMY